jgi:hypothetical protein
MPSYEQKRRLCPKLVEWPFKNHFNYNCKTISARYILRKVFEFIKLVIEMMKRLIVKH